MSDRNERRHGRAIVALVLAVALGTVATNSIAQRQPEPSQQNPRTTGQRAIKQVGTGFAVAGDKIVTAGHGLEGCGSIDVIMNNSPPVKASLIASDRQLDVALLSVSPSKPLPTLRVRGDAAPQTGDRVFMLGFPLQKPLRSRLHSFYEALVTGPGGIGGDPGLYRLGFVSLPGMSGAAVLDSQSLVIGIVRSNIVETAPNGGPTLGGQTFVLSGSRLASFLLKHGVSPGENSTDSGAAPPNEIAIRALAASVTVLCLK